MTRRALIAADKRIVTVIARQIDTVNARLQLHAGDPAVADGEILRGTLRHSATVLWSHMHDGRLRGVSRTQIVRYAARQSGCPEQLWAAAIAERMPRRLRRDYLADPDNA